MTHRKRTCEDYRSEIFSTQVIVRYLRETTASIKINRSIHVMSYEKTMAINQESG